MTVQNAIRNLKTLIEYKQKVLNIIKGHVSKMQTASIKDLGNTIIQVTENDIINLQQVLSELKPLDEKSSSKGKKKSLPTK